MNLRRIQTILFKDLRDVIRDARVLVALIVPLGLGLFYGFAFQDDEVKPEATLAWHSADTTRLIDSVAALTQNVVDLHANAYASEADVRAAMAASDADLGLIIPAGFDPDLVAGSSPELTVLLPESTTVGADFLASALEPAVRAMIGEAPPVTWQIETASPDPGQAAVIDVIGLKRWSLTASYIMMVGMIAMLVVPIALAEEVEKKTFDALTLVASNAEVVVAKLALGFFFLIVMVGLLLGLTRVFPFDWDLFLIGIGGLGLALVGFGLLLAGLLKNANQLNTWSGLFLLPVLMPAFLIGSGLPDRVETVISLLPSGAATRFLQDSASNKQLYDDLYVSGVLLALWALAAFALLLWQLARRNR